MNEREANKEFPCVRNCCLDANDVCLGCFRTLTEIMSWNEAGSVERETILALAEERRAAHRLKWGLSPE